MKTILCVLAIFSSFAFAADFKLNDPAILGEYRLARPNKKSELQVGQVRYNVDNKLVLMLDRQDQELPLTGPTPDGVIYEGQDEPNVGSGDEPSCLYDASTTVRMVSTKVNGQIVPQIVIEILEVDAYKEQDEGTKLKFVLNWSKSIPDAIPYYVSAKTPTQLEKILKDCQKTVAQEHRIDAFDICTLNQSYTYRGSEVRATNKFIKDNATDPRKVKQVSEKKLSDTVFPMVDAYIKSLDQKDLKARKSELLASSKTLRKYILDNYDKIYFSQEYDSAVIIALNTDEKLITRFLIRNKE